MTQPRLTVLGGPNGAGKTTLARSSFTELLDSDHFLNADEIAADINPEAVTDVSVAAARQLLQQRQEWIELGKTFVIESTLASRGLLQSLRMASERGYRIELVYLWVSDPDICIQRIADRVSQGGHYIPPDVVKRRHELGKQMLAAYLDVSNDTDIFDADGSPRLIARRRHDRWITYNNGPFPLDIAALI